MKSSFTQYAIWTVIALAIGAFVWLWTYSPSQGFIMDTPQPPTANPTVTLKTTKGDIVLELFEDQMPITTGNFLKLAREHFYNDTKFHRVISGFMIQGGDPNTKGDETLFYGVGGPGYTIEDEFAAGLSNIRGTISMANTGQPNTGGSQFFINLVDNINLDYDKQPLTSKHPVFGKVIKGMEIVDAIAQVNTGARNISTEPIIIQEIIVREASL